VRKFKTVDSKAMVTPMSTTRTLDVKEEGEHVDQKEYQSMIGLLLYLMATRPDIQFSVCLCACFQASPRTSHRQAVKRILRYLRHTPDFGLWYSTSSSLALHGFIEVWYHILRDNIEKEKISLIHVLTHDQLADIFNKHLDQATLTRLRGGDLGVCFIC
jgi:hypothetical protein